MGGIFGGGGSTNNTVAPVAAGLRVQTSAYGLAIPIIYGRTRITGNLIWFGDFTPIPHTETQSAGGKGGGGGSSSNTTWTYTTSFALGLGEGQITDVYGGWADKNILTYTQVQTLFTKFTGERNHQTPWSYLTSKHAGEDLSYSGIAYIASANYDLGSSETLPNHTFDVGGQLMFSPASGIYGANPKNVVVDILTNAYYGAGFPSSKIGDLTTYSNFCVASGLFLSPAYTDQKATQEMITDLMQVTNSGVYFSEGLLKIVPLSDTDVSGNGATYTAPNTPVYSLTDDDFIVTSGSAPVKMTRTGSADAYNQIQIEFLNSENQYNIEIAEARDQASVETYGLITQSSIQAHAVTDAGTARKVAQMILQRALYVRNTFEFTLSWRFCLLEPTDIITITDSTLGFTNYAVRIVSIEEDDNGFLNVTAEDYPAGVSHSETYPASYTNGWWIDYNISAGNVTTPAFLEVPITKSTTGLAIGVAVTGQNELYGGAQVWVSYDNQNYKMMGKTVGGARYGVTTNSVTSAANQTQNVLLAGRGGSLLSGSATDANNAATLCLIGDEYTSYTTASLLSENNYALNLSNRGQYQTKAESHPQSQSFIRVDSAIAYSEDLPITMIGKPLYFKFLSYNSYGGGLQNLGDVEPYLYNVTGKMLKLPPLDVQNFQVSISGGIGQFTFSPSEEADVKVGGYIKIKYSSLQSGATWDDASDIGVQAAGSASSVAIPVSSGTYLAKWVDSTGNESINATSITTNAPYLLTLNAVETVNEHDAWTGSKTNVVYSLERGGVILDSAKLISQMTTNISTWPMISAIGGISTNGEYVSQQIIDLGKVYTSRVTASIVSSGFDTGDTIDQRTSLISTWDSISGNIVRDVSVTLYVRTTNDDPAVLTSWSGWALFGAGNFNARAYQFKAVFLSGSSTHNIVLKEMSMTVDMPDKLGSDNNIVSGLGVHHVTYNEDFKAVKALAITAENMATGDYYTITNKTATGFDIQFKNTSGANISRTFDYIARGY